MTLLYILSFISILVQICFLALGIIAGIYYLAELVEEYTVVTKRIIQYLILATVLVYVLLAICDPLPWTMIGCGLLAQSLHALILQTFPYVEFASVSFVGALVALLVNHWLALAYFAHHLHVLAEVLAYFTLCLWPVPFLLLVSLCANDNVLPTTQPNGSRLSAGADDVVSSYFSARDKKLGILSLFNYAKDSILPERVKKAY